MNNILELTKTKMKQLLKRLIHFMFVKQRIYTN